MKQLNAMSCVIFFATLMWPIYKYSTFHHFLALLYLTHSPVQAISTIAFFPKHPIHFLPIFLHLYQSIYKLHPNLHLQILPSFKPNLRRHVLHEMSKHFLFILPVYPEWVSPFLEVPQFGTIISRISRLYEDLLYLILDLSVQ